MADKKTTIIEIQVEGTDKTVAETKKIEAAQKKYLEAISSTGLEVAKLKKKQSESVKVLKLEAQIAESAAGSYNQLSAQYSLNVIKLNQMSEAEKKNTAEGKKLVATTYQLKQSMKAAKEAEDNHTLSVGNYRNEVGGAIADSGIFSSQLAALNKITMLVAKTAGLHKTKVEGETAAMVGGEVAAKGMTTSMKVLRIAIASTGIGLLVVAVVGLIQAFKNSEEGQNKWAKLMTKIGVITGNLIDLLADVGDAIIKAFENPKKLISEFGTMIKKNITNRIDGLIELFPKLGEAIKLAFHFKFKEAAKVSGDALMKVATGVDNFSDKAVKAFNDVTNAVKGVGEEMSKELTLADKVANLTAATDKMERQQLVQRSVVEAKVAELRKKAREDDKYTAKERLDFLKEAIELQNKSMDIDVQIKKNRYEVIRLQNTFSRSNKEALDQEAEAQKAVNEVSISRMNKQRELLTEIKTLRKEDAALSAKQAADQLKAIEEERAKKAAAIEEERKQTQEAKEKLAEWNKEFVKQTDEEEEIAKEEKRAADLEKEIEAMTVSEETKAALKQELTEKSEMQIRNIKDKYAAIEEKKQKTLLKNQKKDDQEKSKSKISEATKSFSAVTDLVGKESTVGKTASVAQSTMNTYQGVTEVWKTPSTLPEPFATISKSLSTATVLASGLAAVKNIKNQSFATGGIVAGNSMHGDKVQVNVNSSEMVLTRQQQLRLFEIANGANTAQQIDANTISDAVVSAIKRIPVQVSEQEITSIQKKVSVRESEFTY